MRLSGDIRGLHRVLVHSPGVDDDTLFERCRFSCVLRCLCDSIIGHRNDPITITIAAIPAITPIVFLVIYASYITVHLHA